MIPARLENISESDFEDLLTNSVNEGKTIEYKASLPSNADSDKKEFLADVSSFANTAGGDLIFGIDENQGAPTGLPGLGLTDPDQEIRRLDSIIGDGLEPRIRHSIRVIQRSGKQPMLVVRIERSWIGPHRVIFKSHDRFYSRNSAGKYSMDVSELRSAFTLADSVTERVRHFRAERIARLQNNDTPVPLAAGNSKTVLHSIPLESFAGHVQYDVLKYTDQAARIPPMIAASGWHRRINLDGLVTHSGFPDGAISYTQLFRNGAIEAVENHWLNVEYQGKRTIPYVAIEQGVLNYLVKAFELQKELGVNPPIAVALTLTRTKGLEMASDTFSLSRGNPIIEDDLFLPEVVVESFQEEPGKILKPLFDLVWNACGFPATKTLDDKGNWIYRQ